MISKSALKRLMKNGSGLRRIDIVRGGAQLVSGGGGCGRDSCVCTGALVCAGSGLCVAVGAGLCVPEDVVVEVDEGVV